MTTGHGDAELSAAGAARKAAILAELDSAMKWRNRRRAAGRTGSVVVPALLLAVAVYWFAAPARLNTTGNPGPTLAHAAPALSVEIVKTGSLAMVRTIDDAELQSLLVAAGKPSGIIRTGGRVIPTFELEAGQEESGGGNESSDG